MCPFGMAFVLIQKAQQTPTSWEDAEHRIAEKTEETRPPFTKDTNNYFDRATFPVLIQFTRSVWPLYLYR